METTLAELLNEITDEKNLAHFQAQGSAHQSSLSRAIWFLLMFLQSIFFFFKKKLNYKFGKQVFYIFN